MHTCSNGCIHIIFLSSESVMASGGMSVIIGKHESHLLKNDGIARMNRVKNSSHDFGFNGQNLCRRDPAWACAEAYRRRVCLQAVRQVSVRDAGQPVGARYHETAGVWAEREFCAEAGGRAGEAERSEVGSRRCEGERANVQVGKP